MIRISIGSLAAILATTCAVAQTTPPAPQKEKRICKANAEIGSLIPKRTCRTASEWKEINEANAKAMQRFRTENNPGTQQPQ